MSDTSQPSAPPPSSTARRHRRQCRPRGAGQPRRRSAADAAWRSGAAEAARPGEQQESHIGRREALENAFARPSRRRRRRRRSTPKRAKPGMGHNQPPEAMAEGGGKAEGRAARSRSSYREGGKFARDPAKAQQPTSNRQLGSSRAAAAAAAARSSRSMSVRRTASRRGASASRPRPNGTQRRRACAVPCYQMAKEFQGAYEKYRGDHEVMEELRPYHDLASKQGTSLRKAFDNYYGMEQKLRQDMIGGLDVIVQNMARAGADSTGRSPVTLHDVAHHIVNMTPEQHQLTQQQQPADLIRPTDRPATPNGRAAIPSSRSDAVSAEVHRHPRGGGSVCRDASAV